MAEALATGVTVLTLIDYIDKGVQFARKVAHAREAVSVLVTRLELLRLKLKGLAAFISERGVVDAVFDRTSVLSNILHTYNTKLQVLTTKLEDISNSRTRQLLWPFNEKEYKDSLDDLAKLSDFVDSTLQLDSTALLSKSASQVKELLAKQSHVVKALEALEAQSQSIQHTVQSTQQSLAESQIAKGRQELLHWLSSHDHAARHHECLSRKVESTGLWILNEPDFLKWRDDPQSPSVLCCYGHAGSGKSVLAYVAGQHGCAEC